MIRFSNNQRDLFEFVTEPIYKRVNDPELDKIKEVIDTSNLMDEFYRVLIEDKAVTTDFGRPSKSIDVIIKLLILRRLYRWSYRDTEAMGNDRITVRKFLGLRDEAAPDHTVLSRWNKRIPERIFKELNRLLVAYAKKKKVTSGRKMRTDTTVVEGNIHHPTDSSLLEDSVRKLGALAKKAKELGLSTGERVRDYSRSAKRRVLHIVKYARKRSEAHIDMFQKHYQELVQITKRAVSSAKHIYKEIVQRSDDIILEPLKRAYERYIPRIERVMDQTKRRVFHGEKVPSSEKLISIHEEHLYPIRKGKKSKPVEFGQMCKVQESEGGVITDWECYHSQPSDSRLFIPSIEKHTEIFKKPPHLASGDRGFWSEENESSAYGHGVRRVCIPKRGKKSKARIAHEKQRWFKQGMRFRTGNEATISILKRRYGMGQCQDRGQKGMDNWVALSCIARNLWTIAHAIP